MSGPLSLFSTSKASTSLPLIADGTMCRFRIESVSVDQPEGNRTWAQIKIVTKTLDPVPSSEGHPINAGWPVFNTFPLGTKDATTTPPDWAPGAVSKFIDAVFGTGDKDNKKGKPERPEFFDQEAAAQGVAKLSDAALSMIGKEIVAKVAVKKSKDDTFGDSNVLKNLTFPGDIAA